MTMQNDSIFVGDHTMIMIDLKQVEGATSGPSHSDPVQVTFVSGRSMTLKNSTASMFKAAWRRYAGVALELTDQEQNEANSAAFAQAMGLNPDDMIDYDGQAWQAFMAGVTHGKK